MLFSLSSFFWLYLTRAQELSKANFRANCLFFGSTSLPFCAISCFSSSGSKGRSAWGCFLGSSQRSQVQGSLLCVCLFTSRFLAFSCHLMFLSPTRGLGLLVGSQRAPRPSSRRSACASHHYQVPTYSISLVIHRLCLSHERLVQCLLPLVKPR